MNKKKGLSLAIIATLLLIYLSSPLHVFATTAAVPEPNIMFLSPSDGNSDPAGTAINSTVKGQSVTTFGIDPELLTEMLKSEKQGAVITLQVNSAADVIVGDINEQVIKMLQKKQATFKILTKHAYYILPAKQLDINALTSQFGSKVTLEDLTLNIKIAKLTSDWKAIVDKAAAKDKFTVLSPSIRFTLTAAYDNKIVEIKKFNSYVERAIVLPINTNTNKVSTGIVVDPDGTARPVPTKVALINGLNYAVMNSFTNDIYTPVWRASNFSDLENHWAKTAIHDLGTKMIIGGVGNNKFSPNLSITRAEFAAIIVRALGLRADASTSSFSDVKKSAWYYNSVQTAHYYKLIGGFADGSFHPTERITREQAMTILSKAMTLTGLATTMNAVEVNALLGRFTDQKQLASWARTSAAEAIQAQVVSGRNQTTLAPKDVISRAEVATIVQRLLNKSNLI